MCDDTRAIAQVYKSSACNYNSIGKENRTWTDHRGIMFDVLLFHLDSNIQ